MAVGGRPAIYPATLTPLARCSIRCMRLALPPGMAAGGAYVAWIFTSAVGLAGYYWVCNGKRLLGFGAMGLYAAYGLLAFTHYTLAPMSAHTLVQNATILSEGLTGLLLFVTVMVFLVRDSEK